MQAFLLYSDFTKMSLLVELMLAQGEDWLARLMVGVVAAKSQSLQVHCQVVAYSLSHLVVDRVFHQFVDRCAAHSENRPR
jgi:hypothetical protein